MISDTDGQLHNMLEMVCLLTFWKIHSQHSLFDFNVITTMAASWGLCSCQQFDNSCVSKWDLFGCILYRELLR